MVLNEKYRDHQVTVHPEGSMNVCQISWPFTLQFLRYFTQKYMMSAEHQILSHQIPFVTINHSLFKLYFTQGKITGP